jgi:hypothetical protein
MKINSKSVLYVTVFLASGGDLFGALPTTYLSRSLNSKISQSLISAKTPQYSWIARRYSSVGGSDSNSLMNNRSFDVGDRETPVTQHHEANSHQLDKIYTQLLQMNKLLSESLSVLRSSSSGGTSKNQSFPHLMKKMVAIQHQTSSLQGHSSTHKQDNVSTTVSTSQRAFSAPSRSDNPTSLPLSYEDSMSKKVIRDTYINRIFSSTEIEPKISKEELNKLLDVYSALPHRSIEGVSRVLMGEINTGKSLIYHEVLNYLHSINEDLTTYRTLYSKLSIAAGKDAQHLLIDAANSMMKEQASRNDNGSSKYSDPIDHMTRIISAVNPIYPISRKEVNALREVYVALTHRQREGVSRVLSGQIDTGKSVIYNEVVAFLNAKNANLADYCNMYGRLNHSGINDVMSILFDMIDLEQTESAIPEEIEETKRGSEFKSINVQIERNKGIHKKSDHKLDEELHEQAPDIIPDELHKQYANAHPKLHKHKDETAISGLQPNQALNKDLKRLSRIYGLLPEHHGKSITGVLSGATTNTRLPIWEAIQKAIAKIQEEIFAEGDRTQVDLEYFQKLYSKLLQSSTQDSLELTRHAYSISPLETKRLNRLYTLLPEHHGKSITGVLSGATTNTRLPIWEAIQKAIAKIQEEIFAEDDQTQIDLEYFQKLHWSSMRVIGRGGGRKDSE